MLEKYLSTKEEAESFLIQNCPNIYPVILKPGLVWHEKERPITMPLKVAVDLGNFVGK